MLVEYWMNKNPITLNVDDSMKKAMDLLMENKIHMLPVMENGHLAGTVTDHDLKRAKAAIASTMDTYDFSEIYEEIKVLSFMSLDLVTIPWNFSIEETAEILIEKKINGAPVVDSDGNLEGVITNTDIFNALISLTGLKKRGIQFGILVEDTLGTIKEITELIGKYGGKIASILTSYEKAPKGYRTVYLRMYDINRAKLPDLREALTEKARLLYMLDLREGTRKIF